MSPRQLKFSSYQTHPWMHKAYKKLSPAELSLAEGFIKENEQLDRDEFATRVNRMFLDKEKPKHFPIIMELLTSCNS